jgi:hypothetical protein
VPDPQTGGHPRDGRELGFTKPNGYVPHFATVDGTLVKKA